MVKKILYFINICLIRVAVIYKNSLPFILNLESKYIKVYKQITKYLTIIKKPINLIIKKLKVFKKNVLKYLIQDNKLFLKVIK